MSDHRPFAALLCLLAIGGSASASPPTSHTAGSNALPDGVDRCVEFLAGIAPDRAQIVRFETHTICQGGVIVDAGARKVLSELALIPASTPVQSVVRSQGGRLESALTITEALATRDVTVVASSLCASSCPNYLSLPAARRVVLSDSLVAFHGGVSPGFRMTLGNQLAEERDRRRPSAERVEYLGGNTAILPSLMARHGALPDRNGIRPDFFDIFDWISALPRRVLSKDCARRNGRCLCSRPVFRPTREHRYTSTQILTARPTYRQCSKNKATTGTRSAGGI